MGVTSPFWAPHCLLSDDFANTGYFRHFPYEQESDYIEKSCCRAMTRPLALRLDAEYLATFDRLDILDAHLLLSTASRFGVAASWNHLEERLPDGGRDRLSLGDCNLVYRFAQAGWAEFRTGSGELDGRLRPTPTSASISTMPPISIPTSRGSCPASWTAARSAAPGCSVSARPPA